MSAAQVTEETLKELSDAALLMVGALIGSSSRPR
jgi:hypothetical protein